jgi:replicative DNA helicase
MLQNEFNNFMLCKKNVIPEINSGFSDIDATLSDLKRGNITLIAGRAGMGKTNFAISIMKNVVFEQKLRTVFFSFEMSSMQIFHRLMRIETGIDATTLRSGQVEESDLPKINALLQRPENANVLIDDSTGISIIELCERCRNYVLMHQTDLIIIDYLQLIPLRHREISEIGQENYHLIMYMLKTVARELNISIVLLSSLPSEIDKRENKRPLLSDLNPDIVQYADNVCFIYRAEYYGLKNDNGNKAEFILAKSRFPRTEIVALGWDNLKATFYDLE